MKLIVLVFIVLCNSTLAFTQYSEKTLKKHPELKRVKNNIMNFISQNVDIVGGNLRGNACMEIYEYTYGIKQRLTTDETIIIANWIAHNSNFHLNTKFDMEVNYAILNGLQKNKYFKDDFENGMYSKHIQEDFSSSFHGL
jgi:hypothetical protein